MQQHITIGDEPCVMDSQVSMRNVADVLDSSFLLKSNLPPALPCSDLQGNNLKIGKVEAVDDCIATLVGEWADIAILLGPSGVQDSQLAVALGSLFGNLRSSWPRGSPGTCSWWILRQGKLSTRNIEDFFGNSRCYITPSKTRGGWDGIHWSFSTCISFHFCV